MKTLHLYKSTVLLFIIVSCSPKTQVSERTGGQNASNSLSDPNNPNSRVNASKTSKRSVPNFQVGDLGSGFNSSDPKKLKLKPAADANKVFLVQRVTAYRPVWLNLSKGLTDTSSLWSVATVLFHPYDSLTSGINVTANRSGFPTTVPSSNFSIYQPFAAIGGHDNLSVSVERGDSFKVIGHALSNSLSMPTMGTAILSLYDIPPNDPLSAAILPPASYKNVYNKIGPLPKDILVACEKMNEAGAKGHFPDPIDQALCEQATAGGGNISNYLNVLMGGSTTTGVGSHESFFAMQTLNLWMPVPPAGYQCLGLIATNTPDQPSTTADAGGIYAQYMQTLGIDQNGNIQQQSSLDYPVYCVAEKFLSPGVLVPIGTNGQVDFYLIAPKDSTGIKNQNLFWAVPSSTPDTERQKIKVFVLNSAYTRELPDLDPSDVTRSSTATSTK